MAYQIDPFVFDCPSATGSPWPSLKTTAKRYKPQNCITSSNDGLTLLFFHCIGSHKEQWEPVIAYLFNKRKALENEKGQGQHTIREAWSFDWPTHGDAATLNRELLEERTDSVSVYDWVAGVAQFIRSGQLRGHKLVLCGHSAGAGTAVHSVANFLPDLTLFGITSLILVEPHFMTRETFNAQFEEQMALMKLRISSVLSRRDQWKSRQDALVYFQKHRPWSGWDPRVIQLLVEHGLYELEDGTVVLKCTKEREAEGFPDVDPHFEGILKLNNLCHALPIHVIWGIQSGGDPKAKFIQGSLSDPAAGRTMASVTSVNHCGHMILQEQPLGLAQAIHDVLGTTPRVSVTRGRM